MIRFVFVTIFLGGVAFLLYLLWGGEVDFDKYLKKSDNQIEIINNSSEDLFNEADNILGNAEVIDIDETNIQNQETNTVKTNNSADIKDSLEETVEDIVVNIEILDNEVVLVKKGDSNFRRILSTKKVKNPKLQNGVFQFYEQTDTGWVFKAIHIDAFLDR
jgi:hypothetical protein